MATIIPGFSALIINPADEPKVRCFIFCAMLTFVAD